jgi:penicillin G amidase
VFVKKSVGRPAGILGRVRIIALRTLIVAAGVLLVGGSCLYGVLYLSRPIVSGRLAVAGLGKPVTVSRDRNGSVLIEAADRRDLMFALGFVHAQERFFQMDLMRRTSAGELAALFGKRALESDRQVRLHRFRDVASQVVRSLPAEQLAALDSYTDGINRGLDALAARPFEYVLLGMAPQKWRREDSILVQMSMYVLLQPGQDRNHPEIIRRVLQRVYDPGVLQLLLARDVEWDTPMDAQPASSAVAALPPELRFEDAGQQVARGVELSADSRLTGSQSADTKSMLGSNSWAVSGARTRDHRAIIANDIHLPLQMPNTLFRVAFKIPSWDHVISGVGIPGAPFLVAGSNGHVAWGVTNSDGDWSDVVLVDRNDRQLIHTVNETIQVKGGEPVNLAIEESPWGPIVGSDDRYAYALNWVAQHVEGNNLAFQEMLTADSLQAAASIAASSGIPELNLLVVDSQGNALWTIAGRIPRRKGFTGVEAVAWDETVGWDGWLAPQDYPVRSSKDLSYLWTANNRVVSGPDLEKIGAGARFALGVRARRIRNDLEQAPLADERSLYEMQLDVDALLMKRWHELTVNVVSTITEPAIRTELSDVLNRWDGKASADSAAYRIVRKYRDAIADDVMPQLAAKFVAARPDTPWYEAFPDFETPLWRIVSTQPGTAIPAGFKSWREYLSHTLVTAVYEPYKHKYGTLSRAVWGDANRSSIRHPLSGAIPLVGHWLLDMPSLPMSGDANVIDAQLLSFGPAMRMVVSPGHEADAILTMPGGQSGNPLSPYYGFGQERWARGEPMPLLPQQRKYSLELVPAAASS